MNWLAKRPCPKCGEEVEFEARKWFGSFYEPPEEEIVLGHDHDCELTDAEWDALHDSIMQEGPTNA